MWKEIIENVIQEFFFYLYLFAEIGIMIYYDEAVHFVFVF